MPFFGRGGGAYCNPSGNTLLTKCKAVKKLLEKQANCGTSKANGRLYMLVVWVFIFFGILFSG